MKRLLLVLAPACAADDTPPRCGDVDCNQPIVVRWKFYPTLGGAELVGGCRHDVKTIELIKRTGGIETIACDRREAETYMTWDDQLVVRLRGHDDSIVADALPMTPNWGDVETAFYEDAGFVRISYDLGMICTAREQVELALTNEAGATTIKKETCGSPSRTISVITSAPHLAGSYTVKLTAETGTASASIAIGRNNAVTDLHLELR